MMWSYVATSAAVAAADNKVVGVLRPTHQKSVQGIHRRGLTWGGLWRVRYNHKQTPLFMGCWI